MSELPNTEILASMAGERAADAETIERIIDRTSLDDVIDHLVYICHEKAEQHLRRQDEIGAREWERCARILRAAAGRIAP